MSDDQHGQVLGLPLLSVAMAVSQRRMGDPDALACGDGDHAGQRQALERVRRLVGLPLPAVRLSRVAYEPLLTSEISGEWVVYYFYPGTGSQALQGPNGPAADAAQHRAFCENATALAEHHVRVVGVSSQTLAEQRRTTEANRIGHTMLSDLELVLAEALGLPTFEYEARCWYERLLLLARDQLIQWALYPVTDLAATPGQILTWLALNPDLSGEQ